LSVGKNLRRDEKQDRQAAKNCMPSNCFFPKIKTVEIGEMLHSKIVRRAVYFCPKHQIVKRGNVLRVKLSARNGKQTSQSKENLSFAGLLWLPTTDGTIYSWGLRVAFLSSHAAVVAGCAVDCPHGNPN